MVDFEKARMVETDIQDFRSGKSDLSHLIARLEMILDEMQNVDVSCYKEFRRQWGVLEIELASALQHGHHEIGDEGQQRIDQALLEIERLIRT